MSQHRPTKLTVIIESILIAIALVSLWPMLWDYKPMWYRVWLVVMLLVMGWVAQRRMARVREAANEAKRIRDETERGGRPPVLR